MPLDVDPASGFGAWFRHVPAGGAPLYRPEHPADGRWQRGEVVEGFYLADSEQTTWAEWYRWLAELALPPLRQLPRDLWRFEVDIDRVADLSTSERLARVGSTRRYPIADNGRATAAPRPDDRERLLELVAVLELLSETLRPRAAHDWLFMPNPSLDHSQVGRRAPSKGVPAGSGRDRRDRRRRVRVGPGTEVAS